ncbi:MAG: hypothetical protein ACFB0B_07120 [Thermonemataceae bacterium]
MRKLLIILTTLSTFLFANCTASRSIMEKKTPTHTTVKPQALKGDQDDHCKLLFEAFRQTHY